MAMGDSDLALAMAIAENSSSSQDDDFQLSSHADQLLILNKLTASHRSKRQKRDHLSQKKAPLQNSKRVSKAGKENQNSSRHANGLNFSTFSFTDPDHSQFRKPLAARKQNVRNEDSTVHATKKECRKQACKEGSLGDSLRNLADNKKPKPTVEAASRLLKDSPEKPFKQANVTLTGSRFLAVGDACISPPSRPLSQKHCCKHADETLSGPHFLAVEDCCMSPSRSPSHENHLKHADETQAAQPSLAVDDGRIISSKPALCEHHLKCACVTLTTSHSLVGDDAHLSSSSFSSHEHHLEHACEILTESHSLALHDAHIGMPRCLSNEHHHKQESLALTLAHSVCIDSSIPSLHEKYKQADETHICSPKLSADEDTIEMLRNTQGFSKDDIPSQSCQSPKACDWEREEAARTNRLSAMVSQISALRLLHRPVCKDCDFLLDDTNCDATVSSSGLMDEIVSLAEEDELVIDAIEQKQQPLEPECYVSGKMIAGECLPSANINPESQFSALLHLCVDGSSDNDEENKLNDDTFTNYLNVEVGCLKVEEAITSLLTQTRCKTFVGSSNLGLSHTEEKSSTCEVSQKSHADNATIHLVGALHNDNLEVQNSSFQAQGKPFSSECVGADMYNAGVHLCTEPDLEQAGSALECPVCGSSISNLSLEQREVHTNECLDSMGTGETYVDAGFATIGKDQASKGELGECVQENCSLDLTPVLKWLDTLNLSRYASVFVREEIDWDTLKCLTDEDLSSLGIMALGPRRKILHAIQQLEKGIGGNSSSTKHQHVEINQQVESDTSGRKLITDFFELPSSLQRKSAPRPVVEPSTKEKGGGTGVLVARKRGLRELGSIPEWMIIPGTTFRVDAFQHLRADCIHWFLTHFHTDHYQGLTRGFRYGFVYCSAITAQLVNMRIGVPWERLKPLPLNERIGIDGVKVTLIDANHCPGSVMILFEPQNGKAVLHTGDFRFCEAMANSSVLQGCNIHTLVLDTTYCNPQYDFPNQEVVIQFIIDAIQAEAFNPSTLFLIGTYTIGKERIFFEVAKALQKKIYCCASKLRLLQCMKFPDEDMKWLTTNDVDSHIHVVPLWSIASFKRMSYISRHNHGRYNSIVSFSPTGWSFGRGKKRTPGRRWQQGTIVRYEVPYSEHCSFKELRDFVRFINPVDIVPSVNNDSAEAADALIALLLNEEN